MWELDCEEAEHQRIDCFELWCWRRLLRVPWPARRSNQSILKEISPGCSLEGMMLKLKLQYFGHLMRRVNSLEKTVVLGGIGGRRREGDDRRWDGWMASLTRWTWVWVNSGSWWWTGRPGVLWFMGSQRVGHDWATELNWTDRTLNSLFRQEPEWGTLPVANVMRKEARHTQRRDRASGVPLEILEHLPPKPESAYFLLCALTYTSDFMGGCPPLPLSEKRVNLQLQLIKFLGVIVF